MSKPTDPHPATLPIDQLRQQCRTERLRRSGPGGQHRNKVETAVRVTHEPTGITAEANERRSQAQNLAVALQRLRVNLALDCRSPVVNMEPPSGLWRQRVRGGRIAVNPGHEDFPALLAEALDVLAGEGWDDRAAAGRLGVSRTQLVRFLQAEPRAVALLNDARRDRGQAELR